MTSSGPYAGAHGSEIDTVIVPRTSDIGGFKVQRALPSAQRRMVGPFVFLDQMGPAVLAPGHGLDVAPHPHIGLATVTYLLEGELLHRDSLGSVQAIRPGELNWMSAGRGIVHSERTPDALRPLETPLLGLQAWVALPRQDEESAPSFAHHGAQALPQFEDEHMRLRLIAGELYGLRAPAQTCSALFYADVELRPDAVLTLPAEHEERAVYLLDGAVEIPGAGRLAAGRLVVCRPGAAIVLRAQTTGARLVLLGGEPMDSPRHVWWNFVSSSRERIEQAKSDWQAGRYAPVPGETQSIPLPGAKPPPVDYP